MIEQIKNLDKIEVLLEKGISSNPESASINPEIEFFFEKKSALEERVAIKTPAKKEETTAEHLVNKIGLIESIDSKELMIFLDMILLPELFSEKEVLGVIVKSIKKSKLYEKERLIQIGQEILSLN